MEARWYVFAEKAYYALIGFAVAVIILFSFLTYIFYKAVQGTSVAGFTILIALPILVAIILLFMLFLTGKKTASAEIAEFIHKE